LWRRGKQKRTRNTTGQRAAQKRAVVTLAEGDTIEIFNPSR
jgi:large subunit ribosomal protein L23